MERGADLCDLFFSALCCHLGPCQDAVLLNSTTAFVLNCARDRGWNVRDFQKDPWRRNHRVRVFWLPIRAHRHIHCSTAYFWVLSFCPARSVPIGVPAGFYSIRPHSQLFQCGLLSDWTCVAFLSNVAVDIHHHVLHPYCWCTGVEKNYRRNPKKKHTTH